MEPVPVTPYFDDWKAEDGLSTRVQPKSRAARIWGRIWSYRIVLILLAVSAWLFRYAIFKRAKVPFWGELNNQQQTQQFAVDDVNGLVDWDKIEPNEKLQWHRCNSNMTVAGMEADPDYRCARLAVPMDYDRKLPTDPKVHIAMVMQVGEGRSDDLTSFSESPLIVNPGGPSVSGTAFALGGGDMVQGIVGKSHDVIFFDARGSGQTTPKADCFAVEAGFSSRKLAAMNRATWDASAHDIGIVNSTCLALWKNHSRAKVISELCKKQSDDLGEDSIFKYMSTEYTAHDLLAIVDAWTAWRSSSDRIQSESETSSSNSTDGQLVYLGYSHGTLAGTTFASLFPQRVGRMVLDGVVDVKDEYNPVPEPSWTESLEDADKVMAMFFYYCEKVSDRCSFWSQGDTAADLAHTYNAILESLETKPRIVIGQNNEPHMLTASDVRTAVFKAIHSPLTGFPALADFLHAILSDDFLNLFMESPRTQDLLFADTNLFWPDDAQKATTCSDLRSERGSAFIDIEERVNEMGTSSLFADVWATQNLGCSGWDIKAKEVSKPEDDGSSCVAYPIVTSYPLLIMSNRLDPVSPFSAAVKMLQRFASSQFVEQNSEGHTTLSGISPCTIRHLRNYLNEGKLPLEPNLDEITDGDACYDPSVKCGSSDVPWGPSFEALAFMNITQEDSNSEPSHFTFEEIAWVRNWRGLGHKLNSWLLGSDDGHSQNVKLLLSSPLRHHCMMSDGKASETKVD